MLKKELCVGLDKGGGGAATLQLTYPPATENPPSSLSGEACNHQLSVVVSPLVFILLAS